MALPLDAFPDSIRGLLARYRTIALPLTRAGKCNRDDAGSIQAASPSALLPGARAPEAAVSGLLLLAGCWEESHNVSQDIASREGSYWHAIAHRVEPDSANAGYWFRQVGEHLVFPSLYRSAADLLKRRGSPWNLKSAWDPFLFIQWCEEARNAPGTELESAALDIQRAEWDLLFEWCALPPDPKA